MSNDQVQEILESAVKNQPTKRGRLRGCLITFLVLALPFWCFCIHTTPLRVSKETTYALGPMTSDGKRIDYFRAMEERFYPPQMQTDDNGYRLIVRACGNEGQYRLQVYEKLGLDPNAVPTEGGPTLKLGSPYGVDYLVKYDKENPPAEGEPGLTEKFFQYEFWTFDDFPMLKDWLDENSAGIDLLGEAVRKPAFFIPYTRENENTPIHDACLRLNEVQMMREWARAAYARAKYRVGIGDIDGAIDDIVTLHRLGRHAGRQGVLVSGLVGIAIEGMGCSIGIASNPEFPPTKEQIKRLVTEINALPPRQTVGGCIESERYFCLAAMQDIYWGNAPQSPGGPLPTTLYPYMSWTLDINIILTRANKVYDVLTGQSTTIDGKTLEEFLKPSWNPFALFFVRSRTNRFMDIQASLLIPALQAAREAWRRMECMENMQRLTLALLLYEKDHGKLPDGDWREAIKPFLAGTPRPDENPDKYFRCPSCDMPEGYTTYAMIRHEPDAPVSPDTILLVEAFPPMKLGEGNDTISREQASRYVQGKAPALLETTEGIGSFHIGGYNTGLRSGAVSFVSAPKEP